MIMIRMCLASGNLPSDFTALFNFIKVMNQSLDISCQNLKVIRWDLRTSKKKKVKNALKSRKSAKFIGREIDLFGISETWHILQKKQLAHILISQHWHFFIVWGRILMCNYDDDVCLLGTERFTEPGDIWTLFRGKTQNYLIKPLTASRRSLVRGEI